MSSVKSVKRFANAPHVTLALFILRKLSSLLFEGESFVIHGHWTVQNGISQFANFFEVESCVMYGHCVKSHSLIWQFVLKIRERGAIFYQRVHCVFFL